MYFSPFCLVAISTTSSIDEMKILPSPKDPVCAASVIIDTISSTLESSTTIKNVKISLYRSM